MIERDGQFLLRRRPPGGHLAGLWEFPGGKVEADESWEEALHRELREEIGARVRPGPILEEKVFDYPERRVRLRFYRAFLEAGEEPRSLEAKAPLLWATPATLQGLEVPEANRPLVARLAGDHAPARSRGEGPGTLAVAIFAFPVAVVIAGMTWLALDNLAAMRGHSIGGLAEARFHIVGGDRAVFLGLLLVAEAALVALVSLRRNARS